MKITLEFKNMLILIYKKNFPIKNEFAQNRRDYYGFICIFFKSFKSQQLHISFLITFY